jgi:DNA-binding beta-propeller fold protein YncE
MRIEKNRARSLIVQIGWLSAVVVVALFTTDPASAQTYTYAATLGETGVVGTDNAHFNEPATGSVDTVHGRVFIPDFANDRVQIYDAATFTYIATIGVTGVPGTDNAHLDHPTDVGFDAPNNHFLVADRNNDRVQIFDAADFSYIATIGHSGVIGSDNAHFNQPLSVKINPVAGQIYVADILNHRIQIFDAATFAYIATLGISGVAGTGADQLNEPTDVAYNPATDQIMVADSLNDRMKFYDATSFAPLSQIGETGVIGTDSTHFDLPFSVAFDSANNLVLVADALNGRVQVFSASTYRFISTLGTTGVAGAGNDQFNGLAGISADPAHSHIFIGDARNQRVQAYKAVPSPLVSSVLPGARSVELGATPTMFASLLNAGPRSLANCGIALPVSTPIALAYQTTDPATNTLTGTLNTPVTIPAAPAGSVSAQSFVLSFSSFSTFSQAGQPLEFACDGVAPVPVIPGVNTADLIFSATPVPDVIALVATAQADGIVHVPLAGAGAFAVASDNIGATAAITATLDTGSATLPLTATICQTAPGGQCMAPPASSVPLAFTAGTTPTFSVFVTAATAIPLAPATSRIFVRFLDSGGVSHGATSVAVQTN